MNPGIYKITDTRDSFWGKKGDIVRLTGKAYFSNISDNKFYEFIFIKSSDKDDLIKGNYYKNHSIMGSRLKPLITNTLKKYL